MAEILARRITFLQNNPYGTYVAGDVLTIYLDEATLVIPTYFAGSTFAGIKSYLNGSPITSGAFFSTDPSVAIIERFGDNFCSGTTLIVTADYYIWPFVVYYTQADHYSCAVNPPTCNLTIIGTPTVTPATDVDAEDGAITITATSTNAIQYSITADFVYGAGQTSNVFSGLLPGNYRVYLRDSANCGTNILVTVPYTNAFGVIYRLEYDDIAGFTTKIDILKRGYSGAVTEICGSGSPLQIELRGEGETDKFTAVLASTATLNLTSETSGFFATLYTNDRNLYRVDYYKNTGSGYNKLWTGKLLPFNYQEQVKSPPYHISVVASDGLPELKDNFLIQTSGEKLYGTTSLIKLIALCLDSNKLKLNIRVACNMYATGMSTGATNDPLDQAYIDYEAFYLQEDNPTLSFVLKSILEAFNVRIIQWGNKWNIFRVEELGNSIDYREFDYKGDYSSNGTFNPVVDVDYPNTNGFMWAAFPNLEMRQGYGTIQVNYKLGLKPNIIKNGDFRLNVQYFPGYNTYAYSINKQGFTLVNAGYPMTEGYEILAEDNVAYVISGGVEMLGNSAGGNAYLQTDTYSVKMGSSNQIKINIRYKVDRVSALFAGNIYKIEVPYVKVRLKVTYGSYYLQGDGSWSTNNSTVDFFVTTFNEYQESEIVATQPQVGTPTSGMNFNIRLYHAYGYFTQFTTVASLQAFSTYSGGNQIIPTGYKTELRDDFVLPSYVYYYELEENTSSASGYDIIRPTDYHATNNPRQWILKYRTAVGTVSGANVFRFSVDRIKASYLTDGKDSIDTIVRKANAEPQNKDQFEKDLIIGSYSNLITTETSFGINVGGGIIINTINSLSADLIYTGWLRSSGGTGYEFWSRDGVGESAKLHAIWLSSYAAQYSGSWRLLRGTIESRTGYFGLLNVVNDPNDGDRIYMPISLNLDDFNNRVSGEFLELVGLSGGAGYSPSSPFTSGLSSGFGTSGFN